jgi:hypothetical protein
MYVSFRPSPSRRSSRLTSCAPIAARLHSLDHDVYRHWESVHRDNVDRLGRLMPARVGNLPDAEDLTSELVRTALCLLRLGSSKGAVRPVLSASHEYSTSVRSRRCLGQRRSLGTFEVDPEDVDVLRMVPPRSLLNQRGGARHGRKCRQCQGPSAQLPRSRIPAN